MMISPINPLQGASTAYSVGSNPNISGETRTGTGAPITDDMEKKFPGLHDGGRKDPSECETCKNRKYQDGSDEMVSFKTAQHISPESAGVRVRAHEQEHVGNAYTEAAQNNGKVLRASVAIHTAICPECGRTYVAGGLTTTQIKYNNEKNPYQQDKKARDYNKFVGMNAEYNT